MEANELLPWFLTPIFLKIKLSSGLQIRGGRNVEDQSKEVFLPNVCSNPLVRPPQKSFLWSLPEAVLEAVFGRAAMVSALPVMVFSTVDLNGKEFSDFDSLYC